MNPSDDDFRALVTGVVFELQTLQKQRRKTMAAIESDVFPDGGKAAALCHQAVLHLYRQQLETGKELQKLLESLAATPPPPPEGGMERSFAT